MNVLLKNQPPSFSELLPKSATAIPQRGLRMESADFVKLAELRAKYPDLKEFTPAAFAELRRQSKIKQVELNAELRKLDDELLETQAAKEMIDWAEENPQLERPPGSTFKDMRKAAIADECHSFYFRRQISTAAEYEAEVLRYAEIFVVEHNWASAFASSEVKNAPVRLPYDVCAFEFQFGNRPVIALATQFDADVSFSMAIKGPFGWVLCDFAASAERGAPKSERGFSQLLERIGDQIAAICIALDADVAKDEIVREQHHGAASTRNYAVPKGYHVVSLSRRSARGLPTGKNTARRVRLHFRRGHWRHFEEHKTWIKWMLVGDPELGFIDKHYRL